MMLGDLIPVAGGMAGLGCDASTMVGTDCDSFWYYTWPPCWSNSRNVWSQICQSLPGTPPAGGTGTCTFGICDSQGNSVIPGWLLPAGVAIAAAYVILPIVMPKGRRR